MEEEKRLYPFRFCALQNDYIWGSETFRAADLGYRDSLIRLARRKQFQRDNGHLYGQGFGTILL